MLINNFSAGIIGGILAILAFAAIGPVVLAANAVLRAGVEGIVAMGLLPLASIIIEPAKVLFLNNAINHGVLSPLGIQQAEQYGKSMFFLLEANPGPGFGVLLAYWFFGKGMAKESTPGAMIIHVLGGIHEIYFPYILMKPILVLAVIAGGMSGVFTLNLLAAASSLRLPLLDPRRSRHDAERRIPCQRRRFPRRYGRFVCRCFHLHQGFS